MSDTARLWKRYYDPHAGVDYYHLVCLPGEGNKAFHELCKRLERDDLKAHRRKHSLEPACGLEDWVVWA